MKQEDFNILLSNLDYILSYLKKNIREANSLNDKIYFELSKKEIINSFNKVYLQISKWKSYYELKKFDLIVNDYNEVESIISELELCLAGYEDKFHMNGISYSLYEIGNILTIIRKESDKNAR